MKYVQTPKNKPAIVDALLIDTEVKAVVETKCRQATLETFRESFQSEWLVTWSKIQEGIKIAEGLNVPFVGFLYLVKSKDLLIQRIFENGKMIPTVRLCTTETQATINGGTALRTNAYIDMSNAIHHQL